MLVYVPLYAFEHVKLSPAVAGMSTGILGMTGIVARIAWGRFTERRSAPRTLALLALIAFLSTVLVLISTVSGRWFLWLGLVGFGASAMAANTVIMLAVIRTATPVTTGIASGTASRGLFLGFMLGPLLIGGVVDLTESYAIGWIVVALVCLATWIVTIKWRRAFNV
jgi:cyanate permease